MAVFVRMPEVMAGATEAAIQTWLVQPGATVSVGQAIAEVETDKAVVEISTEHDGVIDQLLVNDGDSAKVGDPIAVLLATGETSEAVEASAVPEESKASSTPAAAGGLTSLESAAAAPASDTRADTTSSAKSSAPLPNPRRRLFVSPLVRRLAEQSGVDVADIRGSGPKGRIVRRDLERHLGELRQQDTPGRGEGTSSSTQAGPTASEVGPASPAPEPGGHAGAPNAATTSYEDVPVDRMRAAIARRLTESKATVPHFYLTAECRVDALLALRTQINETANRRVSVNDFVVKAVAAALVDVPEANAIWMGEHIRRFSTVDIAIAVAIPGGLTTPVLRDVSSSPLSVVSEAAADLAERARSGALKQHELEGGSFSVTNLGMHGTTEFSAILNPPQSGILAVGAARPAAVVEPGGVVGVATVMSVTLSADHRILDGAVAAKWLAAFQRRIENPLGILI